MEVGTDAFGYNELKPGPEDAVACQAWEFKVGDLIFVDKPNSKQGKYRQAAIVAAFSRTTVVHNAIVTGVPPPGVMQTAENVIVTEALKGQWKRVVQNRFRMLVERYPFGGVAIARVDEKKYPEFFSNETVLKMQAFANSVVGQPFDSQMVNPAKKRFFSGGRFIDPSFGPPCKERERAWKMYQAGGPHKWICTQLLAWMIAFPGGLDELPENHDYTCAQPKWLIKDLQPGPGAMLKLTNVMQPGTWKALCGPKGCFIGVPNVPEWNNGIWGGGVPGLTCTGEGQDPFNGIIPGNPGCCQNLVKCTEARPVTDGNYCAPGSLGEGTTCWSTMFRCKTTCT
jgi:hypothetical protein